MLRIFVPALAAALALLIAVPSPAAARYGGGHFGRAHFAAHRGHLTARHPIFARSFNPSHRGAGYHGSPRRSRTLSSTVDRHPPRIQRRPSGNALTACREGSCLHEHRPGRPGDCRDRRCGPRKPPGGIVHCRRFPCGPAPLPGGTGTTVGSPNEPSGPVPVVTPAGSTQSSSTLSGSRRNRASPMSNPGPLGASAMRPGFNVPPPGEQSYRPHEILIDVASSAATTSLDAIARRHRLTRLETYRIRLTGRTIHRLHIDDGRQVADVIRSMAGDSRIVAAEPNYLFSLEQSRRAHSDGSASEPLQYVLAKLHLDDAHRMATGERVLVAVIDTGIDARHPYLSGSIAETFNAVGGPNAPSEHGTAMAGAIAGHGALTGVAPRARLLSVRAFTPGVASDATTLGIIKGLDWAVERGARVVNMSFAGPRAPLLEAPIAAAYRQNVVLVAAAGNGGPGAAPRYPAADPHVIAVTATDPDDRVFTHANRGSYIAVAAPGVDVMAPIPDGGVDIVTGTSIAAAHVSGVAALLIERNGSLRPEDVRRILKATAGKLGQNIPPEEFGAGLVDADAALRATERSGPAVSDSSAARQR